MRLLQYHCLPITPMRVLEKYMSGRRLMLSWAHRQNENIIRQVAGGYAVDNGAYTYWRKGREPDWAGFYDWLRWLPDRDWFVIPDVIDGSEEENDALLAECAIWDGVPVWHMHESFERLEHLLSRYSRVAQGSSGLYSEVGSESWHRRMHDAMGVICDEDGKPRRYIHMLRCLNPEVYRRYPFTSADSSHFARNHHRDGPHEILAWLARHDAAERYDVAVWYQPTLREAAR